MNFDSEDKLLKEQEQERKNQERIQLQEMKRQEEYQKQMQEQFAKEQETLETFNTQQEDFSDIQQEDNEEIKNNESEYQQEVIKETAEMFETPKQEFQEDISQDNKEPELLEQFSEEKNEEIQQETVKEEIEDKEIKEKENEEINENEVVENIENNIWSVDEVENKDDLFDLQTRDLETSKKEDDIKKEFSKELEREEIEEETDWVGVSKNMKWATWEIPMDEVTAAYNTLEDEIHKTKDENKKKEALKNANDELNKEWKENASQEEKKEEKIPQEEVNKEEKEEWDKEETEWEQQTENNEETTQQEQKEEENGEQKEEKEQIEEQKEENKEQWEQETEEQFEKREFKIDENIKLDWDWDKLNEWITNATSTVWVAQEVWWMLWTFNWVDTTKEVLGAVWVGAAVGLGAWLLGGFVSSADINAQEEQEEKKEKTTWVIGEQISKAWKISVQTGAVEVNTQWNINAFWQSWIATNSSQENAQIEDSKQKETTLQNQSNKSLFDSQQTPLETVNVDREQSTNVVSSLGFDGFIHETVKFVSYNFIIWATNATIASSIVFLLTGISLLLLQFNWFVVEWAYYFLIYSSISLFIAFGLSKIKKTQD